MFFSFSLFPPGISARCSRSAFPPGVSARISARISARHFPPAVLGSRSVSALRLPLGACPFLPAFLPCVPSPRFRPAFPPGVWVCATACYSRSAFPPGIPSGGAWLAERFRAPSAFGACPFLPAFLPCVPSPRFRPAFPPGVWVCATACYSRSAFPPGISLRRCLARGAFPRSVCLCGACPLLHGLFSACGYFRIRQKTRLPESGR